MGRGAIRRGTDTASRHGRSSLTRRKVPLPGTIGCDLESPSVAMFNRRPFDCDRELSAPWNFTESIRPVDANPEPMSAWQCRLAHTLRWRGKAVAALFRLRSETYIHPSTQDAEGSMGASATMLHVCFGNRLLRKGARWIGASGPTQVRPSLGLTWEQAHNGCASEGGLGPCGMPKTSLFHAQYTWSARRNSNHRYRGDFD